MTQTPRKVIEETISQASTVFVAQTVGGYGVVLSPGDLKQVLADLDAAEAREQRLKEAVQTAIKEKAMWGDPGNALDVVVRYLQDELATLYPDTPAASPVPKEGTPDESVD